MAEMKKAERWRRFFKIMRAPGSVGSRPPTDTQVLQPFYYPQLQCPIMTEPDS